MALVFMFVFGFLLTEESAHTVDRNNEHEKHNEHGMTRFLGAFGYDNNTLRAYIIQHVTLNVARRVHSRRTSHNNCLRCKRNGMQRTLYYKVGKSPSNGTDIPCMHVALINTHECAFSCPFGTDNV